MSKRQPVAKKRSFARSKAPASGAFVPESAPDETGSVHGRRRQMGAMGVELAQLHGSLVHFLGVRIISGVFAAGKVLPTEKKYSGQLDVSRNAFREAVRYLAAKGLVESRRKRGTRVLSREHWNYLDPDVLAWFVEAQPSQHFAKCLQELRLVVEPPAAEMAARSRDDADLEMLKAGLEEMRKAPYESRARIDAGSKFHRAVLRATHNEVLASLASSIDAAMRCTMTLALGPVKTMPDSLQLHLRLYDAIEQQDTSAARNLMRRIVEHGFVDVIP